MTILCLIHMLDNLVKNYFDEIELVVVEYLRGDPNTASSYNEKERYNFKRDQIKKLRTTLGPKVTVLGIRMESEKIQVVAMTKEVPGFKPDLLASYNPTMENLLTTMPNTKITVRMVEDIFKSSDTYLLGDLKGIPKYSTAVASRIIKSAAVDMCIGEDGSLLVTSNMIA